MEALREEIHGLKMALDLKSKMELDYQEENDRLRQNVDELEKRLSTAQVPPCGTKADSFCTSFAHAGNVSIVEDASEVKELKARLLAVEKENAQLREKVEIFELTDENSTLSISATKEGTLAELNSEIENLKVKLELSMSEKSRFEHLFLKIEDELNEARFHIREQQASLKTTREELANAVAELESFRIQSGSVENSRGNSLFSELEDRRVRAEKLVAKQQSVMEELRQEIASVNSDSRDRILKIIQTTEAKYSKRDTQIISELYSQRDYLSNEVSRLNALLEEYREDELDKCRQANKITEAFRPEENNQQKLISALNARNRQNKYRADNAESLVRALQSKLLTSASARHDLSRELAQQCAMYDRLFLDYRLLKENSEKENKSDTLSNSSSVPSFQKINEKAPLKETQDPIFRWELESAISNQSKGHRTQSPETNIENPETSECITS